MTTLLKKRRASTTTTLSLNVLRFKMPSPKVNEGYRMTLPCGVGECQRVRFVAKSAKVGEGRCEVSEVGREVGERRRRSAEVGGLLQCRKHVDTAWEHRIPCGASYILNVRDAVLRTYSKPNIFCVWFIFREDKPQVGELFFCVRSHQKDFALAQSFA